MTSVYQYRLHCSTEDSWGYVWGTSPPVSCPNNNQHQINLASITIIDSVAQNNVNIIQIQPGVTGENYRMEGGIMTIPPRSTMSKDHVWKYTLGVMTINFSVGLEQTGDCLNCYMSPNTTIGVVTENINQGDTVIHVNSTVTTNIKIGYKVSVTNGSQNIDLGECLSIDVANNTITCDTAAITSINSGSYIQMTIQFVKNLWLSGTAPIQLANKHMNTSVLPTGTVARLVYQNNSNIEKVFTYAYEILY